MTTEGREILGKVCDKAEYDKVQDVVKDLLDTARACKKPGAAGLAANQIGVNLRIIVIKMPFGFLPMVNPEIIEKSDDMLYSSEGCISRPGMQRIDVYRHKKVTVEYTSYETGERKTLKFKGFGSTVAQHEIDHLNGVLI